MPRLERTLFRAGGWACVALLAYLSLIPSDLEIRTGAPGQLEHVIAYFGTAVLLALGYARQRVRIAIALVGYGALLEMLQAFSPGRDSELSDACASGAGAVLGVVAVMLAVRYCNRSEAWKAGGNDSKPRRLENTDDQ